MSRKNNDGHMAAREHMSEKLISASPELARHLTGGERDKLTSDDAARIASDIARRTEREEE